MSFPGNLGGFGTPDHGGAKQAGSSQSPVLTPCSIGTFTLDDIRLDTLSPIAIDINIPPLPPFVERRHFMYFVKFQTGTGVGAPSPSSSVLLQHTLPVYGLVGATDSGGTSIGRGAYSSLGSVISTMSQEVGFPLTPTWFRVAEVGGNGNSLIGEIPDSHMSNMMRRLTAHNLGYLNRGDVSDNGLTQSTSPILHVYAGDGLSRLAVVAFVSNVNATELTPISHITHDAVGLAGHRLPVGRIFVESARLAPFSRVWFADDHPENPFRPTCATVAGTLGDGASHRKPSWRPRGNTRGYKGK